MDFAGAGQDRTPWCISARSSSPGRQKTKESLLERRVSYEGGLLDRIRVDKAVTAWRDWAYSDTVTLSYEPEMSTRATHLQPQGRQDDRFQLPLRLWSYELLRGGIELQQNNLFGRAPPRAPSPHSSLSKPPTASISTPCRVRRRGRKRLFIGQPFAARKSTSPGKNSAAGWSAQVHEADRERRDAALQLSGFECICGRIRRRTRLNKRQRRGYHC